MTPKILITTHDTAKKIEDEPLPWYLFNAIVEPDAGDILQYKDIIQSKGNKTRDLQKNGMSKEFG